MSVSIVELYKQTSTDASEFTLMPVTSNIDGIYGGEAIINMILGMLLSTYHQVESNQQLQIINEDENNKGWAPVLGVYQYFNRERDEDIDTTEYAILIAKEKGYINVDMWDGVRYFKPTEKCLNLELYKFRKHP